MPETPTNKKEAQRARTHAAILASAGALLRSRGVEASSVRDVMKGAGLTVGGFYAHFASKEDLFAAAIRETADTPWQVLLRKARGATGRARAVSVMKAYLSRRHRDEPESGCLLPSVTPEVARRGEPLRSALVDELEVLVGSLSELLGGDAAARREALGTLALMYGALSLSRAVQGTPLADEILRAARAHGARALEGDPLGAEG